MATVNVVREPDGLELIETENDIRFCKSQDGWFVSWPSPQGRLGVAWSTFERAEAFYRDMAAGTMEWSKVGGGA